MTTELKFNPSIIYMEYGHFLFFNIFSQTKYNMHISCTFLLA